MIRTLLSGKIHRCAVTLSDPQSGGGITVDPVLLEAADIRPFEQVQVVNVTNGHRWESCVAPGAPGDGRVDVRGGGARLAGVGDILILMCYTPVADPVPASWQPRVVIVGDRNRPEEVFGLETRGRKGSPRREPLGVN